LGTVYVPASVVFKHHSMKKWRNSNVIDTMHHGTGAIHFIR